MNEPIKWHRCPQCNAACPDNSKFCGECGIAQDGSADYQLRQLKAHEDRLAKKIADENWRKLTDPIPWNPASLIMLWTGIGLLIIMVVGLIYISTHSSAAP
jgi:hypothetical protein